MFLFVICLLIEIGCYISLPLSMGYKPSLTLMVILLVIQLLELSRYDEPYAILKKQYIRIFPILLFSFICVHFQQFIDLLLGLGSFYYSGYSDPLLVEKGAFLSLMALSSLLIGYRYKTQRNISGNENSGTNYNHKFLRLLFSWLFFAFAILFVFLNGRAYLSGNYSQEMMLSMQGSMNAYSVIFLLCSMYAATIENCKYLINQRDNCSMFSYIKSFSPIYYISLVTVLYFNLFLGDRGPLITYLCIYAYGYVLVTKQKISLYKILAVGAFFAIFLSVLSVYRTDENKSFSEFQNYRSSIMENGSISPFTAELAGSTYPTLLALESTPSQYPYRYGLFSLNNIIAAVPFSSSLMKQLGVSNVIMGVSHSSSFLTWYGHGGDLTRSGVGSSTVADVYIDFGPIGIVIILFLIGFLIRYLDEIVFLGNLQQINDFVLITAFVLFSNALYFPRSMVFFFVKDIVWTWVFYKIVCNIFGKIRTQ